MAEGIDEALRADDQGRVLFLLAQHGIRRPAPGSSSKGFCFNEIAKVGGARTFFPPTTTAPRFHVAFSEVRTFSLPLLRQGRILVHVHTLEGLSQTQDIRRPDIAVGLLGHGFCFLE